MRIKKVKIIGFGKWENMELSLDHSLHLIYGENEAGKSTLFQFIRIMLFGFPRKNSTERIYEPQSGQIHGGQLVFDDVRHGEITIERYRNQAKGAATLIFSNGSKGDEKQLQEILHPLTKELFDEIFSFQLEDLLNVRKVSEDQLQHLLLTIGLAGSQKLMGMSRNSKQKQDQLYKPNGKVPILNQKLVEYQQLLQHIQKKEQVEDEYIRMKKEIDRLNEQRKKMDIQAEETDRLLTKINQQLRLWPLYEEYQKLQQLIKKMPYEELIEEDIPKLMDFQQKYEFLIKEKQHWQNEREQSYSHVENPALAFYLENEDRCQKILADQIEVEKIADKVQWYENSIAKKEAEKEKLLRETPALNNINLRPSEEVEIQKVADWFEQRRENTEQLADLDEQRQICFSEKEKIELQLNEIEKSNPKLIGKSKIKKSSGSFPIGIIVLFLAAIITTGVAMVPSFQNLFGYFACLIVFAFGVFLLMKPKKTKHTQIEETWREYLHKLDSCQRQQEQIEIDLVQQSAKKDQLETQWYHFVEKYGFSEILKNMNWHQWVPSWYRWIELDKEQQGLLKEYQAKRHELKKWEEQLVFLQSWIPLGDMPTVAMYRKAAELIKEWSRQKERIGQSNQQVSQWMLGSQSAEKQSKMLLEEVQPLLDRNHLKDLNEFAHRYSLFEKYQVKKAKAQELALQLQNNFELDRPYTKNGLLTQQQKYQTEFQNVQAKIKQQIDAIQPLNYEIHLMETDGTLSLLYQEKADQWSEIENLANQWVEERLKENVVSDLLAFLSDQQLPALLATASSYLKTLTEKKYQKCILKNGELQVVHQTGRVMPISELSTGTQDQLYVAIRFAFIFLHQNECSAPVIIDDGWLHYDQTRKTAFFHLLEKLGNGIQILCLSSDTASLAYFQKQKLPVSFLSEEEK